MASLRILIVDDEVHIRNAISRWFEARGFDVDVAENGQVAVEKCALTHYDVITMDIEMPVMKGTEAIQRIRQIQPETPTIVVTAYYDEAEHAKAVGAAQVLMKPLALRELEQQVRAVLAHTPQRGDAEDKPE